MTSATVHYSFLYLDGDYTSKAQAVYYVTTALKWSSIAAPIGIFSGLCARLSVCLFLLRIFRAKTEWKLGLYAVMIFATTVIIPTIVSLLAQCTPVQKLWNPALPGSCWSPQSVIDLGYFTGGKSPHPLFLAIEANLILNRSFGTVRLDFSYATHCFYVEYSNEIQDQDRHMLADGNGLFVRHLQAIPVPRLTTEKSTGICAIVRTTLFSDGTAQAEQGKC